MIADPNCASAGWLTNASLHVPVTAVERLVAGGASRVKSFPTPLKSFDCLAALLQS